MELSYKRFMEHLIDNWEEDEAGNYDKYLAECRALWRDKFEFDLKRQYGENPSQLDYEYFMTNSCAKNRPVYVSLLFEEPIPLNKDQTFQYVGAAVRANSYSCLKILIDRGVKYESEIFSYIRRFADDRMLKLLVDNVEPEETLGHDVFTCKNPQAIILYMRRFSDMITPRNLLTLVLEGKFISYLYIIDNLMNDALRETLESKLILRMGIDDYLKNLVGLYLLSGRGDPQGLLMISIGRGYDEVVYAIIKRGEVELTEEVLESVRNFPFTSGLLEADV